MFFHLLIFLEVTLLRDILSANGGAIIERQWLNDRGNEVLLRITAWVGQQPHELGEGLGDEEKNV